MGNAVCVSTGSQLGSCGCFDWCSNQFWFFIPTFFYRLIRLILWLIIRLVVFVFTLISIVCQVITSLYPTFLFLALALLFAWLWWFFYPDLAPYVRDLIVPILNLFIQLFIVLWNIGILLWNVFAGVWNGMVPVIGMIIYIAMEVLVTVLQLIVQILGALDVQAIFKPFMEILKIIIQIALEVLQALLSAALPLLKVLSKIIGAVVTVVMKVVEVLLPIVKWLLQILFKILQPILFIIVLIAKLFARIVGGGSRSLLSVDSFMAHDEEITEPAGSLFDDFHYTAYGQAYPSATRHWNRESYIKAKEQEQEVINNFITRNPVRSFDYYWTTQRPYLTHLTYEGVYAFTGTYENNYGDGSAAAGAGGGRRLMEAHANEAHARGLLSQEEHQFLTAPHEDMSNEEYWKRHDTEARNSHEHQEWYQRQFFEKHAKRQGIVKRLQRRLMDANVTLGNNVEMMTDDDHARTDPRQQSNPWKNELHKKIRCQSAMCGGHGANLPHAVHKLRELTHKRQQQPDHHSSWKSKNQTMEAYHKNRFIHMSALIEALHLGNDRLEWHMQNPVLHKHFRDAFNRTTGFETVNDFVNHVHTKHGDFYQAIHNVISPMGDHPAFVWLRTLDPEHKTRPFYWDWIKTVQVRERREARTGRKVLTVDIPSEEAHDTFRKVLEDTQAPEATKAQAKIEALWHKDALQRLKQERLEYQEYQSRMELDPVWEETHNPQARKLQELPFAPNPIPNALDLDAEARRRQDKLYGDKPHGQSPVTLFELLTQTDCYTTTPRNPLCLFTFPASWAINGTFRIHWPDNATGDDFCDYLYRPIPRDFANPAAWISFDWIWNAFQSLRIIISALSSALTNNLGLLDQQYGQWLGWVIQPMLAFPPGYMPNGIDWVCFAIYMPYSWLLVGTLGYLIYLIVYPLLNFVLDTIMSWSIFQAVFIAAEQQRMERLKQTEPMFTRASKLKEMNPPHILRPEAVYTVPQVPTVINVGGKIRVGNPYTDPKQERYRVDRSREDRLLAELEVAMMEAADEMGMPYRWELDGLHQAMGPTGGRWSRLFCRLLAMASGAHVREDHLEHFEHRYNWFLHSYQMSPYWLYQKLNYLKKQARVNYHYSPVEGSYQRGYTHHTEDNIIPVASPNDEEVAFDV
jgi:hypothetical protein